MAEFEERFGTLGTPDSDPPLFLARELGSQGQFDLTGHFSLALRFGSPADAARRLRSLDPTATAGVKAKDLKVVEVEVSVRFAAIDPKAG